MQRKFGTGSVTKRVRKNGRVQYWVRGPLINGRRESLGYFNDYDEAAKTAGLAAEEFGKERIESVKESTFIAYATNDFLPRLEVSRPQSHDTYKKRLRRIAKAEWTTLTLSAVARRDIKTWVTERMRKRETKRVTIRADLSLVKSIFNHAIDDELLEINPARGICVERDPGEDPPTQWADMEQQKKILLSNKWSFEDKLPLAFVMMTGLRKWEFLALRLDDIHWEASRIHVQRGLLSGPTKSKKSRWVPLIAPAYQVLDTWVHQILPGYCKSNPRALVFPGQRGGYRVSWVHRNWRAFKTSENITLRFHDLRHTTGSALVNGIWGRQWSLGEVRDMLGHSSIKQTERYAHTSLSAIDDAAACTTASMVHTSLFGSAKHDSTSIQRRDPLVPCASTKIAISKDANIFVGTTNGGVCTTSVADLLDGHPLAPVARALEAMRVV